MKIHEEVQAQENVREKPQDRNEFELNVLDMSQEERHCGKSKMIHEVREREEPDYVALPRLCQRT